MWLHSPGGPSSLRHVMFAWLLQQVDRKYFSVLSMIKKKNVDKKITYVHINLPSCTLPWWRLVFFPACTFYFYILKYVAYCAICGRKWCGLSAPTPWWKQTQFAFFFIFFLVAHSNTILNSRRFHLNPKRISLKSLPRSCTGVKLEPVAGVMLLCLPISPQFIK